MSNCLSPFSSTDGPESIGQSPHFSGKGSIRSAMRRKACVWKRGVCRIGAVQEHFRLGLFPTSLNQETHNRLFTECLMWITAPHRTKNNGLPFSHCSTAKLALTPNVLPSYGRLVLQWTERDRRVRSSGCNLCNIAHHPAGMFLLVSS